MGKKEPKTGLHPKNRAEFLRIRGDLVRLPSFAALRHPSPPGAIGRQCAISPWPSSSGDPEEGGGAATSSSQAIGTGRRTRACASTSSSRETGTISRQFFT